MLMLVTLMSTVSVVQAQSRTPKPLVFEPPLTDAAVYVIPIEGMIDNGLSTYIERAIGDATEANASLLIFHVDTFGGLVDAADKIRQSILDAPMPTLAFIDKNAASAGALISYAADRIVMVPGASIGAATVVDGIGGEAAPDKYQSYMRSQMRATAEANGRDPRIAEAMVDETLVVVGVSEAGQVLTLSSQEALQFGVADAILESEAAVREAVGVAEQPVIRHRATRAEEVLRFFASPIVQSILMLMMLGGLYFELQTPGVGFAGSIALVGAAMFFAPHYLLGLVESWEMILFFVGIALILVELFVIPGFGVAGISGILMVVVALIASLIGNVGFSFPPFSALSPALGTFATTLVLLVLLIFAVSRYLPRSEGFNRLVLQPDLSSLGGYTSADTRDDLVGRIGTAITTLRPSGTIEVDGERIDVITAGEFIVGGTPVEVVRVRGSRVEVRPRKVLPASGETSPI